MADETTPRQTGGSTEGGDGPAPATVRRRRRATSPATAPMVPVAEADQAPAAPTSGTASGEPPVTGDAAEEPARPARSTARRSRRATSPAAAPSGGDTADGGDGADAGDGAEAGTTRKTTTRSRRGRATADEDAPPARTRRRTTARAASTSAEESGTTGEQVDAADSVGPAEPDGPTTSARDDAAGEGRATGGGRGKAAAGSTTTRRRRKAAEPEASTDTATTDTAPADTATTDTVTATGTDDVAEATADAPAPAARPRRSRRATPKAETAPEEPSQADLVGGTTSVPEEAPEPAVLDVLAELGRPRETPTTEPDTSRLAATALLFQAPEPSRSRRRRASAPAGPPSPAEPSAADADAESTDEQDVDAAESTTGGREDAARTDAAAGGREDAEDTAGTDGIDATADTDDAEDAEDGDGAAGRRRRRRRGGRGRRSRAADLPDEDEGREDGGGRDATGGTADKAEKADRSDKAGRATRRDDAASDEPDATGPEDGQDDGDEAGGSRRRRRRRSRGSRGDGDAEPRRGRSDEVTALKGSTRLEAKRQRRREGRDAGRRRSVITEAEFLARREAVERTMVVRETAGRIQIAVLEDGVLVEHFVARTGQASQAPSTTVGNVYLGRVQNVLPSMEAAFVDVGKGRNAVLYAGEVNWDAAGLEGQPRRIEQALKSGDPVLVQVTKDPIGHKGARLTSQVSLAGRYLVYVPGGGMTGISRKLPDTERSRLKKLLKEILPDDAGVIVRTAAEGASDEELRRDVQRLQEQWAAIQKKSKSASAPSLLHGEPDLAIRVVRDIFNDDFRSLVVQGDRTHATIADYVSSMAPDLAERVSRWTGTQDVFAEHRVDEQLAKGMDRKVWLPSGGSLVIDRTEAMTVVDVNTGKFTGAGGTLEETVTRNNLEAAEEIVRQLRLRDIGGIIVIDFIDMVLESNRDLVLRRLVECLGRDRTKHQVAEVTSLGLVQMTRKRVGQGLVEAFSEPCEHCNGRGYLVQAEPVERRGAAEAGTAETPGESKRSRRKRASGGGGAPTVAVPVLPEAREAVKATLATIAAAAAHAHEHENAAQGGDKPPGAAEADLADAVGSVVAVEEPAP